MSTHHLTRFGREYPAEKTSGKAEIVMLHEAEFQLGSSIFILTVTNIM